MLECSPSAPSHTGATSPMELVGLRFKKLVTIKQARVAPGCVVDSVGEQSKRRFWVSMQSSRESCPALAGVLQYEPRVGAPSGCPAFPGLPGAQPPL